jgi:drug/metabolite transporter (DMT)-like permease
MRSSPALVLVTAVLFLGEQISIEGVCGILLVAVGVYIINMKRISGGDLLEPINSRLSTFLGFLTFSAELLI